MFGELKVGLGWIIYKLKKWNKEIFVTSGHFPYLASPLSMRINQKERGEIEFIWNPQSTKLRLGLGRKKERKREKRRKSGGERE